jgi:hypothetical protein
MTTHENHPDAVATAGRGERLETMDTPMDPPGMRGDVRTDAPLAADDRLDPPAAEPEPPMDPPTVLDDMRADTSLEDNRVSAPAGASEQSLFGGSDLSGLRARWTEVQSEFVDDPRDCVQKADGLVGDVVDKLTQEFSQARSRLEEQWARGEQVSTEDLRVALKRYREFFERLLAV